MATILTVTLRPMANVYDSSWEVMGGVEGGVGLCEEGLKKVFPRHPWDNGQPVELRVKTHRDTGDRTVYSESPYYSYVSLVKGGADMYVPQMLALLMTRRARLHGYATIPKLYVNVRPLTQHEEESE